MSSEGSKRERPGSEEGFKRREAIAETRESLKRAKHSDCVRMEEKRRKGQGR